MPVPSLDPITKALAGSLQLLHPVTTELVPISATIGRVLAEPLTADRDSPAMHVSAMDGYAVRLMDVVSSLSTEKPLRVSAVSCAGYPPAALPEGEAVQIFTGAPVPVSADCVVRREDTQEAPGLVRFKVPAASLLRGQHIRRQGENIRAGAEVLPAGTQIGPGSIASLMTFGSRMVLVRRRVQVAVLTSGDELVAPGEQVQPWQIRDSNSATLQCWLALQPWIHHHGSGTVGDSLEATRDSLSSATANCDAVILSGGVSAGDTDCVLPAIESLGGSVVFHRLPIRPGRPVLVAMLSGKLIIGLPGNPVSTAVTSRLIAQPLLERLSGCEPARQAWLHLCNPDNATLDLYWYRLFRWTEKGAALIDTHGSGDLVSIAQSDGFVEIPPGCTGQGPWRTWLW